MVSEATTKHTATPGPWVTIEQGDGHIGIAHRYRTPDRGPGWEVGSVAVVSWAGDEMEPNARLIAAAPDLLAALEAVMDSFGLPTAYLSTPSAGHALEAAQSAIAKARGEAVYS